MCSGSLEETELLLRWRSFLEGFIQKSALQSSLEIPGMWSWKEVVAGTENTLRNLEIRKPQGYNQCLGQNGLQSKNREQVIAP